LENPAASLLVVPDDQSKQRPLPNSTQLLAPTGSRSARRQQDSTTVGSPLGELAANNSSETLGKNKTKQRNPQFPLYIKDPAIKTLPEQVMAM